MKTYEDLEVQVRLKELEGWKLKDGSISKSYKFKDFKEALNFIVRVGMLAEHADHHPEIYNVYNKVKLSLNTHSAGGITDKDFDLAREINEIRGSKV